MGWEPLMPAVAGLGRAGRAQAGTGAPAPACRPTATSLCGIHDSNASLLRYLGGDAGTVLSTGTWLIAASFGTALGELARAHDMLANTNALGQPVACMRFMGGREFGELAGDDAEACGLDELQRLIARGTFALPCFAESGGPFSGQDRQIVRPRARERPGTLRAGDAVLRADDATTASTRWAHGARSWSKAVLPPMPGSPHCWQPCGRSSGRATRTTPAAPPAAAGCCATRMAWRPGSSSIMQPRGQHRLAGYKRRWAEQLTETSPA